jgi:hypothetical protein
MRFNTAMELMVNRPHCQLTFEFFKRLLHLIELRVKLPQFCRIRVLDIGTQKIPPLASPGNSQRGFV